MVSRQSPRTSWNRGCLKGKVVGRCKQVVAALQVLSQVLLYQAHGCWCFHDFLHDSMFFIWIPSLSLLCVLVDMVLCYKIQRVPGKFLECILLGPKPAEEVHEAVQLSWASRLFWCGAELSKMTLARRILHRNVSRSASACLCNRQTDAWSLYVLCKINWEVWVISHIFNLQLLGIKWECPCLKVSSFMQPRWNDLCLSVFIVVARSIPVTLFHSKFEKCSNHNASVHDPRRCVLDVA